MYSIPLKAITQIINEDGYINIVISQTIGSSNLSDHERRLFTRIIYGTVEHKILIDYLLRPLIKGKRLKPYLKNTLRMGTYMLKMMNLANHHIVNELVHMIKKQDYKGSQLINAVLREVALLPMPNFDNMPYLERIHLKYSMPHDLLNLLYQQYQSQIEDILAINAWEYNVFRINTLKTNATDVEKILKDEKISYEINGVLLSSPVNLIDHPLFINGFITPQDASSQRVAKMINPKAHENILDGCSAPGSKAFHLATLMNNTGLIVATDIYPHKMRLIEEGAKRLGVTNLRLKLIDIRTYPLNESFDHVLIDAPCSGLGVLSHKVDLKYRMTPLKINELIKLQKEILDHVAQLVKDEGHLTYSTCTINEEENEMQISNFLKNHPTFNKVHEEKILPTVLNDGFYLCKMQKKGVDIN